MGYCPNHATGVKFGKAKIAVDTISPLGGKEIIVIDALHCKRIAAIRLGRVLHKVGRSGQ